MKRGTLLRGLKSLVRLLPIFALVLAACLTDPDARKPGRLTVSGVVHDTTFQRTSALVELLAPGLSEPVATTMADPSVYPGPTFVLEAELPARTYICGSYKIRASRADSQSLDWTLGPDYGGCVVRGGRAIHQHVQFGLILFPPLRVVTTSLPDAPLNFAYSQRIVARSLGDSNPMLWSVTHGSLPTGLTLSSDGHITGTPTSLGTFHFTAQVTGNSESGQQALSIMVGAVVVLQPSDLCSGHPAIAMATFEDANLEAAIRTRLGFGTQEAVTCAMLGAMTALPAQDAGVTSLIGIQNLAGLHTLVLGNNRITDIRALSGLTSLITLDLDGNPDLTDIQPLLDNTGLGAGSGVQLRGTNVSCRDVTALKAKGLTVVSDCR